MRSGSKPPAPSSEPHRPWARVPGPGSLCAARGEVRCETSCEEVSGSVQGDISLGADPIPAKAGVLLPAAGDRPPAGSLSCPLHRHGAAIRRGGIPPAAPRSTATSAPPPAPPASGTAARGRPPGGIPGGSAVHRAGPRRSPGRSAQLSTNASEAPSASPSPGPSPAADQRLVMEGRPRFGGWVPAPTCQPADPFSGVRLSIFNQQLSPPCPSIPPASR